MPDNTKKECRCGHLDDSHIYNDFGLGHCMLCMCERFSSIDKNKEEVCPCGGKRVEGKCTRPVVNLEPPLSELGKALRVNCGCSSFLERMEGKNEVCDMHKEKGDDWEKEFGRMFPLAWFATENYTGEANEYEFNQWTRQQTQMAEMRKDVLVRFIRQQRIQAQRELAENVVRELDIILANYSIDRPIPPSIMRKFQDDLLYSRGLLSNNKE